MDKPTLILPGLYLSSIDGLDYLDRLGITHILSVINQDLKDRCKDYTFKQIYIADAWATLIVEHFNESYEFIHNAIKSNNKVLVHCHAGVSRSATIVCAYIMKSQNLNTSEAIKKLKSVYPPAFPNPSFTIQLDVYYECNFDLKENNTGLKLLKTKIDLFNIVIGDIKFDDVAKPVIEEEKEILFRCKKCNRLLATTKNLVHSWPIDFNDKKDNEIEDSMDSISNSIFVEPLVWMKYQIQNDQYKGKLYCPNCKIKLGFFDWGGYFTSYHKKFVPGMKLHLTKLDVIEMSDLVHKNIENSIRKPKLM